MDPAAFPVLRKHVGEDLIVTDGTTLLGADDKAGHRHHHARPARKYWKKAASMERSMWPLPRMKRWEKAPST